MEQLIFLITLILGIVLISIGLGKMLYPDYSILEIINTYKRILVALFTKPYYRHEFDGVLKDDLRTIIYPYSKIGFGTYITVGQFQEVPTITIQFVPKNPLEENERDVLVQTVRIKFQEYLKFYGFIWNFFVVIFPGSEYIKIRLFYCEYDHDNVPFRTLYRKYLRRGQKNNKPLRDKALEKEIDDVG